jgi:hypothetical protein
VYELAVLRRRDEEDALARDDLGDARDRLLQQRPLTGEVEELLGLGGSRSRP